MYKLFTHRDSYGMTAELVLEELEIEYELIVFNVHVEAEWPEAFTSANPNGSVHGACPERRPQSKGCRSMIASFRSGPVEITCTGASASDSIQSRKARAFGGRSVRARAPRVGLRQPSISR